ncbi:MULTISPECIES: hypothetical protein [Acinetobacter]|uniref:hypothetical protein n=1 Tax=Acinetobacter TaxID=469 RepID=UPI0015BF5ECD|nr:hypothetical protein [Acinetobacter sp. SwsAc5]NWK52196.1 hypothetical protein [Acinetobacter sp. SwsAc5]
MSQYPSHSNTPQFDANKSQTSECLYQHPTHEDIYGKPSNFLSDFFAFALLFGLFFGTACMFILAAERESAKQVERMVQIGSVMK